MNFERWCIALLLICLLAIAYLCRLPEEKKVETSEIDSFNNVNIALDQIEERYSKELLTVYSENDKLKSQIKAIQGRLVIKEVYRTTHDTLLLRECCNEAFKADSIIHKQDTLISGLEKVILIDSSRIDNLKGQVKFNRDFATKEIQEKDKVSNLLISEKVKSKKKNKIITVLILGILGVIAIK